jgi:4-amino-4-deoxy-L-arabinose transferase-like glycosyltransferase
MHRYTKYFLWFLAAMSVLHAAYGAYLGLGDDEAYYWEWGRHPALSYFDHPPMTAWVSRICCTLAGNTQWGARLGAIVFSSCFMILLYAAMMKFFNDRRRAFFAVVFVATIPLFTAGGFMMVPDAMLALFWIASIYAFSLAVNEKRQSAWYALGTVFGLGLLSKYNMVMLPICVLTFLILSRDDRFWLKRKEPYLAVAIGLLLFSPVLIWNGQRGFPSFAFHLIERNASAGWSWRPFRLFLAGQFGYLSPLVYLGSLVAMMYAGYRGIKRSDRKMLLLFAMSVPYVLIFSLACSISPTTKPHWPAMGYVAAFMVMVDQFCRFLETPLIRYRRVWLVSGYCAFGISVAMSLAIYLQSIYPVVALKPKQDPTNELYGWPTAAAAIERELDSLKAFGKPVFLWTPRYNIASQVTFYTRAHYAAYSIARKSEQHDVWGRGTLDGKEGANSLCVADNRYRCDPAAGFVFDSVRALPPIGIYRAGRQARQFYLYRCYGYRGKTGDR